MNFIDFKHGYSMLDFLDNEDIESILNSPIEDISMDPIKYQIECYLRIKREEKEQ